MSVSPAASRVFLTISHTKCSFPHQCLVWDNLAAPSPGGGNAPHLQSCILLRVSAAVSRDSRVTARRLAGERVDGARTDACGTRQKATRPSPAPAAALADSPPPRGGGSPEGSQLARAPGAPSPHVPTWPLLRGHRPPPPSHWEPGLGVRPVLVLQEDVPPPPPESTPARRPGPPAPPRPDFRCCPGPAASSHPGGDLL